LLALFAIPFAWILADNWKDKTFTALVLIQLVHALALFLISGVLTFFHERRWPLIRLRFSINGMMMWTFIAAVAIWIGTLVQPHFRQTLMIEKLVIQPSANYWIPIVSLALALNSVLWNSLLKSKPIRVRQVGYAVVGSALLGYGSGVLFHFMNTRWDATLHSATSDVHTGYMCCFFLQGAMLLLLDSGAACLSNATNHPMHRRTGHRDLRMDT